uniref:Uncharacterized protein n=1 Tax=Hyaloperonospora arabidopsidis (strain Emoy2) TaxID=559515 RepID=M4BSW2_HYAAE
MDVGAPNVDTPSPKSSSPAGIWNPARVSTLRQSFQPYASAQTVPAEPDVCPRAARGSEEHEHKPRILHECARGEYRYRMDGFQREMSSVEERTLMAWLKGDIFLPPKFVTEIYVGAERDEFISYFRKRLCPRLYGRLPVGFT